jgi:hypothetical protein
MESLLSEDAGGGLVGGPSSMIDCCRLASGAIKMWESGCDLWFERGIEGTGLERLDGTRYTKWSSKTS